MQQARHPQLTYCARFIQADSEAISLNKDSTLRKGK